GGGRPGPLRGPLVGRVVPARHPGPVRPRPADSRPRPGGAPPARAVKGGPPLIPLTVPEVRRLLLRLVWDRLSPAGQVLAWSEWRRRHQAFARACHYRKRQARAPD